MKRIGLAIALLGLLTLMFRCDQKELFDLAKNGVTLIYAVTTDATNACLLISDGKEYYKEFTLSPIPASPVPDRVYADRNRNVFVLVSSNKIVYFTKDKDPGREWGSQAFSYMPVDITEDGQSTMILFSNYIDPLYSYNDGSYTWSSRGKTMSAGNTPARLCYDRSSGQAFLLSTGSSLYVYNINNMPQAAAATPDYTFSSITSPFYFSYASGVFNVGNSNYYYAGTAGSLIPLNASALPSAVSYAATDGGVYAGVNSPNLNLEALEAGNFAVKKTLPSTIGQIVMAPLNSHALAVGISASTMDDGLYVYDTETNVLTKLLSRPIYALYVR